MNTSPWGNPVPAPEEPEAGMKPFYYEVGSEEDKIDFVFRNADLRDALLLELYPFMKIMGWPPNDVLILSYREEIDEIAINPEIPAGYFRLYHLGSKTDFKEFTIYNKKVA